MANPSTIWAQLALPNSSVGVLPFVGLDGATISIDSINYYYTQTGATLTTGTSQYYNQLTITGGIRVGIVDTSAIPGAAVINKPAGRVKFAAATSSLVVTSNYCFATSVISVQLEGPIDATALRAQVTSQANGTFTISLNANATAALTASFTITNVV